MRILFCIASAQSAANINPISEINPDKIVVVITDAMKSNGDTLAEEMKKYTPEIEQLPIKNETSITALTEQFSNWLEDHIDDEIIVNITGGTKLMSLSAYQVFNSWGFRCFYCDKNHRQLIWLDDESTVNNIGSKINLEHYLRIYQFQVEKKQTLAEIPKSYKNYTNLLYKELCKVGKYDSTSHFISKINAHTMQPALDKAELKKFAFNDTEYAFLEHLIRETKLFNIKKGFIQPIDDEARQLMNGGWIEILTADCMRQNANFRDIAIGVNIAKSTQRANRSTRQEIDVMAMHQDQLVIIECKTKKWNNASDASEAIYKLSALSDIGGLNTKAFFVSLYDLPPSAKTRAAEHGIKVICGDANLRLLTSKLRIN